MGCIKTFLVLQDWNAHHCTTHKSVRLYCAQCPRTFKIPCTFRAHVSTAHREKKFSCDNCNLKFAFKSAYRQHRRAHLKTRIHRCFTVGCEKEYKWPQDRSWHLQKHLKKTWSCEMCHRIFYKKWLLRHHHVKHHPNNIYWCEKCNFGCKYYTQLFRHLSVCKEKSDN